MKYSIIKLLKQWNNTRIILFSLSISVTSTYTACISLNRTKPPQIPTRPVSHYHCSLIPCLLLHVEPSDLFIRHILLREVNAVSVTKNYLQINTTIELVDTSNLKIIFRNTHGINFLSPTRTGLTALLSRVVYKASCWDCDDFYIGKTKRRSHDRKTEHFKALSKNGQTSAIADHITSTRHNIKWDHFQILATERSDIHVELKSLYWLRI